VRKSTQKTDCFSDKEIDEELHELEILLNIGDFDVNTINNGNQLEEHIVWNFLMIFTGVIIME